MVDASRTLYNPALHDYAKSPQYCEILASNLVALLTLEPTLLQETLARMKSLLPPAVNALYVPGSNIPNGVESFPMIPYFSHQGTESEKTPYLNDIMPTGSEGLLEIDWLKHDASANHDLREGGHQGLVNNAQSRLGFTSESRVPDIGEDPKRSTRHDDDLAIDVAAASYPSPKSNPSHTPKFTNSALKRKVRISEKSRKRTKSQTASTSANQIALSPSEMPCSGDPNENGQLSLPDEAVRLNLLRFLAKRAKRPINDKKLHIIYQAGDKIISDTGILLNDLKGWLLEDYRTHGISLPPCHNFPSAEIVTTMFRFLMETKNDEQQKSVHRRLAQVIFFIFVNIGVERLKTRDQNGETIPRSGNDLTAVYHKSILANVGELEVNGKKCDGGHVSDCKNYGKRWWKLASSIGIITVLTCGLAEAIHIDNRSNFPDSSLELLISYMRNAYPDAIAHFQSLDPFMQPLFANLPMSTNQVVELTGHIDPLYLKFSVPLENPDPVDTKTAMDTATKSLLQYLGHRD
ncbi:uncharacterized protein TRUGW13939_11553 [Talaromyces rugulosus]|uniref:Uncharacterized protein n=1 Tax=Talaromyces rugulosus TaxID=121627 RepID=A0A7H8RD41_TALRU|nr:uncharacterized protein TRUGW13939_11553 [Talaromyces rugulosus]QKX64379.1 hypothetical protein TRUGW13939_11553 [Talaromyces rugulosus]